MDKILIALTLTLIVSVAAYAQLTVTGQGDSLSIDTSGFPPQMQLSYKLMMQKCSQCHTIERVIIAVQTGVTPLSKTSFTKDTTRAIVKRMFLKPASTLTKKDVREIVLLLNYLLDLNMQVTEKTN
jgi:hypothetical protein